MELTANYENYINGSTKMVLFSKLQYYFLECVILFGFKSYWTLRKMTEIEDRYCIYEGDGFGQEGVVKRLPLEFVGMNI